jgi:hypothetical protein
MVAQRRGGVAALALPLALVASVVVHGAAGDATTAQCAAAAAASSSTAGACRGPDDETESAAGVGACDAAGAAEGGGSGSCPSGGGGGGDDQGGDRSGGEGVDGNPPEGAAFTTATEFLRDRYIIRFNDYRMVGGRGGSLSPRLYAACACVQAARGHTERVTRRLSMCFLVLNKKRAV